MVIPDIGPEMVIPDIGPEAGGVAPGDDARRGEVPQASPRIAQTRKDCMDEKVFRATVDLLRTAGTGAVTVEAVSARSGVAKTTFYRRSRRSLVQMCWRASGLPSPELRQRPIEACGATYTGPGGTADGNVVTANESMSSQLFGLKITRCSPASTPPGDRGR